MSAAGMKYRPGTVFSALAASSFFSRTAISLVSAIVVPFGFGCLVMSGHLDRFRLLALGAGQEQSQDPVAIFGLDAVRIDLDRHGHGTVEPAREPLTAMHRGLLRIGDRLDAGEAQRAALHLHVEV